MRAEGVIEDEEAHVALKLFVEARETAKQAEARKKAAGEVLGRYNGVILSDDGPWEVSQTLVAGGSTVSYDHQGQHSPQREEEDRK